MGPAQAAAMSRVEVSPVQAVPRRDEFRLDQEQMPSRTRVAVEHERAQEQAEAPVREGLATGVLRRGFMSMQALRGINLGLTTSLALLNAAQGNTGLAFLWGAAAVCWGLALVGGSKSKHEGN